MHLAIRMANKVRRYRQTLYLPSFGKVVFQNLAKIEMTQNKKIGYLATILKRNNILFFLLNCNFL